MVKLGFPLNVQMSRWAKMAVAVLLGVSLGMQWTVLQSVAWATMLVDRTGEAGLTEAVRTTFDGRHPCSLCQVVQKGREAQKKQEAGFNLKKIDVTLSETIAVDVVLREPAPAHFEVVELAEPRFLQPAVPPPRAV